MSALPRLARRIGLERNVGVMYAAVLILGMGEELWMRFLPKYLELVGASVVVIGAYGALKDLLDGLYPYPGGWLTDHVGRRQALALFSLLAMVGYVLYLIGGSWPWIMVGTVFVAAWSSLTLPAIFAIIGDHLPSKRRAMAFGVQSILKRVPIVLAPLLGAALIGAFGFIAGVQVGLVITLALALATLVMVLRFFHEPVRPAHDEANFGKVWRDMDRRLKRLLVADILVRWAEDMPRVLVILYAMNLLGVSVFTFGWLTGLQMAASILVYLPLARLSDRALNRKPFVLASFVFFALFPLLLVSAAGLAWLVVAFLAAGLRELGEPARKALIVDLAPLGARGRAVGMYYLVRGLAVFPAALAGGWLWTFDPRLPFYTAFAVGAAGLLVYAAFGPGRADAPGQAGEQV